MRWRPIWRKRDGQEEPSTLTRLINDVKSVFHFFIISNIRPDSMLENRKPLIEPN